jgi:hypothetical protein
VAYANMIVSERTQYRRNVAVVMGGFVPYAFALYVMAYLGLASLWKQITSTFTIGGLIFGVFWLLIGYWMLHSFWIVTELGNSRQIPG